MCTVSATIEAMSFFLVCSIRTNEVSVAESGGAQEWQAFLRLDLNARNRDPVRLADIAMSLIPAHSVLTYLS